MMSKVSGQTVQVNLGTRTKALLSMVAAVQGQNLSQDVEELVLERAAVLDLGQTYDRIQENRSKIPPVKGSG